MDGNATRGMLGGGPASQHPRMQSQQIRGALPRTVTPVSSRYPQLLCVLMHFSENFHASRRPSAVFGAPSRASIEFRARWIAGSSPAMTPCEHADVASSGLTMPQRAGALCIDPEQGVTIVFMISKPKRGLLRRGEGPLMGAAALYPQHNGDGHGWADR